jgi:hypothetical protein
LVVSECSPSRRFKCFQAVEFKSKIKLNTSTLEEEEEEEEEEEQEKEEGGTRGLCCRKSL